MQPSLRSPRAAYHCQITPRCLRRARPPRKQMRKRKAGAKAAERQSDGGHLRTWPAIAPREGRENQRGAPGRRCAPPLALASRADAPATAARCAGGLPYLHFAGLRPPCAPPVVPLFAPAFD